MRKITSTGNAVRDWQKVHRLVWEDANGPVPDGHFVVFRDGDKTNVSIKNLVLLPAADAARRASELYSSYPKEVRMAMRALGKLKKAISEKS
ncbi:HNH endonuclease signature motif containing protein [Lysobacter antibioticus]|uniref:HNH endonuclease signature motif containing protein n=1 Tax=Lysobacter antibioticus TaxID=84531 RepID=UPI003D2F7387